MKIRIKNRLHEIVRKMNAKIFFRNTLFSSSKLLQTFFVLCKSFFFLSRFLFMNSTIHMTAGEGGGYLFNSSLHFHPLHSHLGIGWAFTEEISPLHVAHSKAQTRNSWSPSASCEPLTKNLLELHFVYTFWGLLMTKDWVSYIL